MNKLLAYIVAEQRAGYTEQQIRQALADKYTQAEIDNAFASLQHTGANVVHDYVQEYARQGYTAEQIFSTLVDQGNKPGAVKRAIRDVFGKTALPQNSKLNTAVYVLIALFIGAGGMYFLSSADQPVVPEQTITQFSPSSVIATVLEVTRTEGAPAGIDACQTQLTGIDRDKCLAAVAVASQDDTICTQIVDLKVHDSCLLNLIGRNFEICDRVKLTASKDTCNSVRALQGAATFV